MIPAVGWRASALYLWNPARLATMGRQLGPRWSFRHPVFGSVPVVSDPALAAEVFAAKLRLAGGDRLVEWLGFHAPTAPAPPPVACAVISYLLRKLHKTSPRYHLEVALRDRRRGTGDAGPGLRAAALGWLLDAICDAGQAGVRAALAATLSWQRAARTAPLLLPSLRPLYPSFAELAPARLRVLQAIAECEPGRALDGPDGSHLAGCIMALLGPVADALPMVTMAALAHRDPYPGRRLAHAMTATHPVPLLILEAARLTELSRCGLVLDACPGVLDEDVVQGQHVAVDLVGSNTLYGAGLPAALLQVATTHFVAAATEVASELDIVASKPRRGRVRLAVGPVSMNMSRWTGPRTAPNP